MMRFSFVISFLAWCSISFCFSTEYAGERKNYDGYKVLDVMPTDQATVRYLRNMMLTEDDVDFWSEPSSGGRTVTLMVTPGRHADIRRRLENAGIQYSTRIDNMKPLMESVWRDIDEKSRSTNLVFDINNFNNYTEITNWMRNTLVPQCREGFICQVVNLGMSHSGNNIDSFRISKEGASGRRAYYIDATTHAREWIATATILKILNALVLGTSDDAIKLTNDFDWHIIPIVNPDGYIYTWTNDRFWRKNRKPNGSCFGTDLNRNFDHEWGTEGVSDSPCSNTFCGSSPASEPETQVLQTELRRLAPTLKAVVTTHAFGNFWMFPWGYTVDHAGDVCARTSDHDDMMRVANIAADAVQDTYETVWQRGSSCEEMYPSVVTGSKDDYAKGRAGIKYVFPLALRGNDVIVDKSEIDLSFNEVFNGIIAMVSAIV